MPDILVNNNFYISTSDACIADLTAPTFAGINFLDVESRGQIRAGWSAATDANLPLRYEIYIQASTAVGLFNTANIVAITPNLQYDIFTMPDGSFLVNGTTYYVGVRAVDALSNRDANTVSLNVISTGVLTSIDVYNCEASWSIDSSNNFRLTMWANKNDNLAISPNAVMGTASYQVYDRTGAAVVGMSQAGITIDGNGFYVASSVANLLSENLNHYELKVSISVDGEVRTNMIPLQRMEDSYNVSGVCTLDNTNNIIGSFWVTENEKIVTSSLGTGSFQLYTADGNPVVGYSQAGIAADVNGYFVITPISLTSALDLNESYVLRATVSVNGVQRSQNIVISTTGTVYTCRATFSINAGNQLEATFWATINDVLVDPALLGTASYTIYDKNGNAVAGLTESGITPDGQGLFHSTPASATLLTDLTHYSAKITISVAGQNRVVIKGFTLLGN